MKTFKQHLEEQTKLRDSATDTGDRSYDSIENIRAGAEFGANTQAIDNTKQTEEKRKQENKDKLERNTVANSLKLQSRVLGPGESWGDAHTVNRHDQALTIATGLIPNGGPGSFPSLRQQMTAEKIWDTDIGLAYDLDDDGAVMADQAGMKALQNRRKIGKSIYFKKETPTDYIKHIFSGKGIKGPYDD
tara:strand:+ start:1193 stop:1759 length:567 start_codon:yes stop_codon:yes gene_type:complete